MSISTDLTWLQKHERLIIVFMILLAGVFCFNKYLSFDSVRKDAAVVAATQAASVAAQAEATAQKQAQADKAAGDAEVQKYQELIIELQNQNKVLISTIQNANIILAKQQAVDQTLPVPDLVSRWNALIKIGGVSSTATSVNVTPQAAHETVNELESVPVLEQEVADGTKIVENTNNELAEANKVNLDLTKEVKDDTIVLQAEKTQSQADLKKCTDQIAAVKADGRKSKRNWFLRGMAVGGTIVAYVIFHI
jgi:hypothetical protein